MEQYTVVYTQIQTFKTALHNRRAFWPRESSPGEGISHKYINYLQGRLIISLRSVPAFIYNSYCVQHKRAFTAFTDHIFLKIQASEKRVLCFISSAAALISAPLYICEAQALYFTRNI